MQNRRIPSSGTLEDADENGSGDGGGYEEFRAPLEDSDHLAVHCVHIFTQNLYHYATQNTVRLRRRSSTIVAGGSSEGEGGAAYENKTDADRPSCIQLYAFHLVHVITSTSLIYATPDTVVMLDSDRVMRRVDGSTRCDIVLGFVVACCISSNSFTVSRKLTQIFMVRCLLR